MVYVDKPPAKMTVIAAMPRFANKWQWKCDEAVADWKSTCSSSFSTPFSIGSSFMPVVFLSWLWSIFQLFFESRLVFGLRIVGDLSIPGKIWIYRVKSTFLAMTRNLRRVCSRTPIKWSQLSKKYHSPCSNRVERSCFAIGKRFVLGTYDEGFWLRFYVESRIQICYALWYSGYWCCRNLILMYYSCIQEYMDSI